MTTQSQIRTLPTRPAAFKGIFARLVLGHAAWRQRRALENLDETALNDIGLSREQALAEARKPVWDVPAHWRR